MCDLRLFGAMELAGIDSADLGPPQRRALLAALALNAGTAVSVDGLVDRIWADPPAGARRAVYVHVARLRQLLAPGERSGGPTRDLAKSAAGYLLDIDRDQVDLLRFERLVQHSAPLPVDDQTRREALRDALALWRGVPLAGLGGAWVEQIRQRWHHLRAEALQHWAESELAAANPAAVVRQLRDAVTENPGAEPLAALLMRALAAVGQAAEALRLFATLREHLADELGVEPGTDLRELHRTILHRNIEPLGPESAAVRREGCCRVPAQLPATVPGFVGRDGELAALIGLLNPLQGNGVPIAVVTGPPGVGKTAMAVRWSHDQADRFPGGRLFADLGGTVPASPAQTLAGFLRALGVRDVPDDRDERSALLRSRLAGRRVLVVLDNAASSEQLYPLLPGCDSCAVLVTSRDPLAGLVARNGARRLEVGPLREAESVALLRTLTDKAGEPSTALRSIAASCAGLPLALRVAAELASRYDGDLHDLAADLLDEQFRLAALPPPVRRATFVKV